MNQPDAPPSSRLRLPLRPTLVLVVGVSTACVIAAGAWFALKCFEERLLETAQQASAADGDEIRGVFEAEMLLGHRSDGGPVLRLVHDVARAPGVIWVGIVDVHGTVKTSSDGRRLLTRLPRDSAEYAKLLEWRNGGGSSTHAMLPPMGSTLRTLTPLPNAEACQRCHSAGPQVNGMLIVDRSLDPIRSTLGLVKQHVVIGGTIGVALLLGILGFTIERLILRRIHSLRDVAWCLGRGDLAARSGDHRADELGDLARDFDEMAGRLESALGGIAGQRRQLEELVNGISDGILVLDTEGRVITSNRAFAARAGGPVVRGSSYRELLQKTGLEAEDGSVPPPVERALVSGKLEKQVFVAADGERIEELYAQPLHDEEGRVSGVIEVWRDITDRRALEVSLERSERLAALGVLASSVAHEVGNPLAAIVTAVDGLLARAANCPDAMAQEIREYLEMVRKQVFRCRSVTQRLLGFSRVPGEKPVVVDVARSASDVLGLVHAQATKQGVQTELRSSGIALAIAPDMLIEQVFLNIVLNALKAMPSGGKLVVGVTNGDGGAAVTFSDSGGGIPEKARKHLFQAFRRPNNDGTGTGLGLFISHSLVERIGGAIEVESRSGEGTTFTVRLRPLSEPRESARPRAQEATS